MKKVILGILAISAIGFTSCKKCSECHYEALDSSGMEVEVEFGEHCGDDLKDLESIGYQLSDWNFCRCSLPRALNRNLS